jgi:RNA polymerase sigma factor (sigma-70 family)
MAARNRPSDTAGFPGEASPIPPGREALLRRVYDEGRANYGPLDLPFEVFARRVLELVARPSGPKIHLWVDELAERLNRSGDADLYLAIACDEKIPGAWEVFQERYVPKLRTLAHRNGARGAEVQHIAEGLLGDLFTPPKRGKARTHLGTYSGAGSLIAWLAAVLNHRMTDERRSRESARRSASGRRERDRAHRPGRTDNPSEEFDPVVLSIDGETCRRFGEVLREGLVGLTEREREAMVLKFRNGLPQAEVARRMEVGEPRVSRLLRSGVKRLQEAVAAAFPGRRWEELDRLWMALRLKTTRELEGEQGTRAVAASSDPGDD